MAGRSGTALIISLLLVFVPGAFSTALAADTELLRRGATIYLDQCRRCHGPYAKDRVAEEFPSVARLARAIGGDGCRISWAKNLGGSLSNVELNSVAAYLQHVETTGQEVEPLVSEPRARQVEKVAQMPPQADTTIADGTDSARVEPLPVPIISLLKRNEVARGGYLYTQHCYRCHLSYGQTRQGREMSWEKLTSIIANGKTSTQMRGFSMQAGGKLYGGEISAISRYILTWEAFGGPPALPSRILEPPAMDPAELKPIGLPRFPPVLGDAAQGHRIYIRFCSRCHGIDRQGMVGPKVRPPWNTLYPELWFKSIIKNGVPDTLMVASDRLPEARLSARAIDDLVIFLTTSSR